MRLRSVCAAVVALLAVACVPLRRAVVSEDADVDDVEMSEEEDALIGDAGPWSAGQLAVLNAAIARATQIASDTAFLAIVRESAAANEIVWTPRNLSHLPDSVHDQATEWTLRRFAEAGHFRTSEIGVGDWTFDRRLKRTTRARTVACPLRKQVCTSFRTRFHPKIVDARAVNALANTVVHERIHAFGQVHVSQRRRFNYCEAPSVIGDIGESLLAHRDRNAPVRPRQKLCPPLEKRLRARGIVR